jgi:hypothetical protein
MVTPFEVVAFEPIEWQADITSVSENADGQLALIIDGGLPPYNVLWSNGLQGTSLENLEQGSYSAIISDAAGCSVATEEWLVPLYIEENEYMSAFVYDSKNGLRNRSHQSCEVQIIDSSGRTITREVLAPGASFSCSQFACGYYWAISGKQVLPFAIQR